MHVQSRYRCHKTRHVQTVDIFYGYTARMSGTADVTRRLSHKLSEVMSDIGVNEHMVMFRRRRTLLNESIESIPLFPGRNFKAYRFGSQSESSTTLGIDSDFDKLIHAKYATVNVIHNLSECKHGFDNKMAIQRPSIFPGYCYIQSVSGISSRTSCLDKNSVFLEKLTLYPGFIINGPAISSTKEYGSTDTDDVYAYYGEIVPSSIRTWIQKYKQRKWPPQSVLNNCKTGGCFVVPVSSKLSDMPEYEWRISTAFQERFLMFSLNITQLSCYVLLKMILKTHINPHVPGVLTSFMCKNVLWYCITNSSIDWHSGNLLPFLRLCMFMLKACIAQRNCPHFLNPENNLLVGRMTETHRKTLLIILDTLVNDNERLLFPIEIDDIGQRLKIKLNMIEDIVQHPSEIDMIVAYELVYYTAVTKNYVIDQFFHGIKHLNPEAILQWLFKAIDILERHEQCSNTYLQEASRLMKPLVSSTLGSVIACQHMNSNTTIPDYAFTYLRAGTAPDALSGRLKLCSVLYAARYIKQCEEELNNIETNFNVPELIYSVCGCYRRFNRPQCRKIVAVACLRDEDKAICTNEAFCTKFLPYEINCVPHELRYELWRICNEEDRKVRTYEDLCWMDNIVVNSSSYFYFLQYKVNGELQRKEEQWYALANLAQITVRHYIDPIDHIETTWNLLGQCLEHENHQVLALYCYKQSLRHRPRHNAASLLICIQLFKLLKQT